VTTNLPAERRWLRTGTEFMATLHGSIAAARGSVRLEFYIVAPDATGTAVRDALADAAGRGVAVRVLVDALGTTALPSGFWRPVTGSGGEVKVFNPLTSRRLPVRDHRKLVVVDDEVAIVGGFNLSDDYAGDGVASGWADCGLVLRGPAVAGLSRSFDLMSALCDAVQPSAMLARLRTGHRPPAETIAPGTQLLLSGPGRKPNAFQRSLREDVAPARTVRFVSAYFLPEFQMRRLLRQAAKRGALVQVIVPGKSDVALSQRAARHLYTGLLRAGVEIWEYEPQVLHTKLFLVDGAVYAGSSNLDTRSLHINHELMIRLTDPEVVAGGEALFADLLGRSRRIDPASWRTSRSWLEKLRERCAFWILSQVDPYVTRWMVLDPR